MDLLAVALGIGLGISLAAPPGPMNALIAREASRHGAGHGVRIGLGAPVADVVYLAALWFGLRSVLDDPTVLRTAAAAGAGLMTYFAYTTWFSGPAAEDGPMPRASFLSGFAAAMTNPYQIAWWLSGGFVFLQAQGTPGIAGLMVGIFGWVVVFSWLVAHGANRWAWFPGLVRRLSGGLLALFAVLLLAVAYQIVQV